MYTRVFVVQPQNNSKARNLTVSYYYSILVSLAKEIVELTTVWYMHILYLDK